MLTCEVFPFPFRHHSAWPYCSCRARSGDVIGMSSVSVCCLLTFSVMSAVVLASPFPGSPLVVSLHRPVSSCRGTGSLRGCLLVLMGSCLRREAGAYRALDVMLWPWSICCASVACLCCHLLPTASNGWRRRRERLRCDTAMGGCLLRDAMAAGASCGFLEWGGGWAGCVLGMR